MQAGNRTAGGMGFKVADGNPWATRAVQPAYFRVGQMSRTSMGPWATKLLHLRAASNVQTTMVRAFTAAEMDAIPTISNVG
jgi:hypothetical protein